MALQLTYTCGTQQYVKAHAGLRAPSASQVPGSHFMVHSSLLAFQPLAATPPPSNPQDLPTPRSLSSSSYSLSLAIFRSPLLSPTAPCPICFLFSLPWILLDAPEYFLSPCHSKKPSPLIMEWSCQQCLYRSPSHTLYPVLKPSQWLSSPSSLCRESKGTPMGLPNQGSHLCPIHEGGREGERWRPTLTGGSHGTSFAG